MTAPPARNDIGGSGNPSRATAKLAFTALWDYVTERLGGGIATADSGEQTTARTSLGAGTVGNAVFVSATQAAAQAAVGAERGVQAIDATVASNALTLTLSPATLDFRNATITSGASVTRNVASAITLVISSGSTLGTTSGVASRIALLAIDNAGSVELAAVNANGGFHFDESQLISTTAEGGSGAADSSTAVYSATARTNVAFRFVGYAESTQAAAGTWATSPSKKQGGGGSLIALAKAQQIFTGATVATTSGTAIDVTGIPAFAKRITLLFVGLSANAGATVRVRLGTASSVETTSYSASYAILPNAAPTTSATLTDGFAIPLVDNSSVVHGSIVFTHMGGNTWVGQGGGAFTNGGAVFVTFGSKSLAGILDRVRLDTVAATAFDSGFMTIAWE